MNRPHPEVERRNKRIVVLFYRGMTRKRLAFIFRMNYELVKKIVYVERLRFPRT